MPHFKRLSGAEWLALAVADVEFDASAATAALRRRADAHIKLLAHRAPNWAIPGLRRLMGQAVLAAVGDARAEKSPDDPD